MKPVALLVLTALAAVANNGLPARHAPGDYPTHQVGNSATVAADWMGADQVKGSFSTDLSEYIVVEVAIYPRNNKSVEITALDFSIRADGRLIRPVDPRAIANINQKRSNKRRDDVALYPTVGMSTGTWGTGVGVGVGVGRSGRPGPASSPRDRDLMEMELEDKVLQDGPTAKPVAGYLYFPVGKKKATGYDLEYQGAGTDVKLRITSN